MASVEKHGKGYRAVVSLGYRWEDGKRKKLTERIDIDPETYEGLKGKRLEKRLDDQAAIIEDKVKKGQYLQGEKITVAEFYKAYEKNHIMVQADSTKKSYTDAFRDLILPAFGGLVMAKVQTYHVVSFVNNLREPGIRRDSRCFPKPCLPPLINKCERRSFLAGVGIQQSTRLRLIRRQPVQKNTAQKVADFLKWDITDLFEIEKKAYADMTVKFYHSLVSSFFKTAILWGVIKEDPTAKIRVSGGDDGNLRCYEDLETISRLFHCLNTKAPLKYRVVAYTAIDTGARRGEIAGLEWDNLDLKKQSIRIEKQRIYIPGKGTFEAKLKTKKSRREVSISDLLAGLFLEYEHKQKIDRLEHGDLWKNTNYIFVHEDGTPIAPVMLHSWFVGFLKENNLPHIPFHSLRHLHATLLIYDGVDIATVSGRLGHTKTMTTFNKYVHAIKNKDKIVANKMDALYSALQVDASTPFDKNAQ